jgi:uncharacterized protein YozE (UPF0346 family)
LPLKLEIRKMFRKGITMSSTTVHSKTNNQKNTTSVAGTVFKATEKTLEIPPKGQVFEVISNYVEEQGNLEIPVGNAIVTEKNQMVKQDGTTLMLHENAFETIAKNRRNRNIQRGAKVSKIRAGESR